jgi:hypothetical protein
LPRCTRIPTRASKAAAKTVEYPPCRLRPPITLNTQACPISRCIEATPDRTNTTTVTAVAVAPQHPQTMATIDLSPPTTSTLPSRLATQHKTPATMTWSFPNARCTEYRILTQVETKLIYYELMAGHKEFERQGLGGPRYRS